MTYNRDMPLRDMYFHLQMKLLKIGDRVELLDMPDDPNPIKEGTRGTVESITDDPCDKAEYIIGIGWDNGRTLNLCSKVDRVMKIEIGEEAKKLWAELGDIPINEDEEIDVDWHTFTKGTNRFDIWHWFEEKFDLSVAKDLIGI
jgi:hypothetical protein